MTVCYQEQHVPRKMNVNTPQPSFHAFFILRPLAILHRLNLRSLNFGVRHYIMLTPYFWWKYFLFTPSWFTSILSRSRMEHAAPGSKRSSKLHKTYQYRCTAKNSWWWAERLPETCRVVIPINLEFSASVGFIHKEFVTMHGHTILKCKCKFTFKVYNIISPTWFASLWVINRGNIRLDMYKTRRKTKV